MNMALLFGIFLSFILFSGALGLKTIANDCWNIDANFNPGEKMLCYHEAAITQAILCNKNDVACQNAAADICKKIFTEIAQPSPNNIKNIGEMQRNYCLTDVAKYTRNDAICNDINQDSSAMDFLKGADTSKEICTSAVTRLRHADPGDYLNRPDNICSLALIFPPVLYLAFLRRKN